MVSIIGLDKAAVLAALYNASRPLGMGFIQYKPEPMTTEQARAILDGGQSYFDYLEGRVMKLSLRSDIEFDPRFYDHDNSTGAAQRAVDALCADGENSVEIQAAHRVGVTESAIQAEKLLGVPTNLEGGVLTLGLGDVAEDLRPKIRQAIDS